MWRITFISILAIAHSEIPDTVTQWDHFKYELPAANPGSRPVDRMYVDSVAVWKDTMFMVMNSKYSSVPFTLSSINLTEADVRSPILQPYPSFNIHDHASRTFIKIYNMSRININACDRLWGLDRGIPSSKPSLSSPRIIVINLNTKEIIRLSTINSKAMNLYNPFRGHFVVDVNEDDCDNAHAYFGMGGTDKIVVYSFAENEYQVVSSPPVPEPSSNVKEELIWVNNLWSKLTNPAMKDRRSVSLYYDNTKRQFGVSIRDRSLEERNHVRESEANSGVTDIQSENGWLMGQQTNDKRSSSNLFTLNVHTWILEYTLERLDQYELEFLKSGNGRNFKYSTQLAISTETNKLNIIVSASYPTKREPFVAEHSFMFVAPLEDAFQ